MHAETAYLFSDVTLNMEKYAKETGAKGLHQVVYHLKMFMDAGVDAVITNYPDFML